MTRNNGKTPNGKDCLIAEELPLLQKRIYEQARGTWQEGVAGYLIRNGYVVGYEADGTRLRGKAGKYGSKYAKSLDNLMVRIEEHLPLGLELKSEQVGQKGAWGYRLVTLNNPMMLEMSDMSAHYNGEVA